MGKRRTSPWLTGFMVLVVGVLIVVGVYATKPDPPRPKAPEPDPAPVNTRRMELENRLRIVRCFGETVGLQTATVACEVPGRVIWRSPSLESGARVRAGEALLKLDDSVLIHARDQARAALDAANAEVAGRRTEVERARAGMVNLEEQRDIAERDNQRFVELMETGDTNQSLVDQTRRTFLVANWAHVRQRFAAEAAQAVLDSSIAAVAMAEALLSQAEYDLKHATVVAAFSGEVSQPMAEVGDWMVPGNPVCVLINRAELRIVAQIPNEDSIGVGPATQLEVRFPSIPGHDGRPLVMSAEFLGIEPVARSLSRSREIVGVIPNPELKLPVGAFAELLVIRGDETALWLRPYEFVLEQDTVVAFVVAEGPRAEARELVLGRPLVDEDSRAWHPVLAGLRSGELVAVDNLEMLEHGLPLMLLGEPAAPAVLEEEPGQGR